MSSILGISAFYHDSAACILKDGKIIAAAQEERFTRKKNDPSYPENAIKFDSISFQNVLDKNLKIMDSTAFTLSQENNLPIIVFNMNKPGNLLKLVKGNKIGTTVN